MSRLIGMTAGLLLASIALSGCEGTRQVLGIDGKKAPDEFAVLTKAPLIIPPDFSLRPPAPGQRGPQDLKVQENARNTLLGSTSKDGVVTQEEASAAGTSAGELALLRKADAEHTDPAIRDIVDRETSTLAENDETLVEKIMFWQTQPKFGSVVDPTKEKKRIQENAALGNSPAAGGDTPTIERQKKALLEGLFD